MYGDSNSVLVAMVRIAMIWVAIVSRLVNGVAMVEIAMIWVANSITDGKRLAAEKGSLRHPLVKVGQSNDHESPSNASKCHKLAAI